MLSAAILSTGHQFALNDRQEVGIFDECRCTPMLQKKCLCPKAEAVLFETPAHLEEEPSADRKAQVGPVHFQSAYVHISFDGCQSVND